jgi:glutathione S-transferase
MKFYHVHWCPECQLVQAKLDELGVTYDSIIVPDQRPQRTEVHAVSGQYYVPVLQDEDAVLTETRDIVSYLESKYGQQPVRPSTADKPGGRERA